MLALQVGQAVFIDELLVLGETSFGGLDVIEIRGGLGVDGGVHKDGVDGLVSSATDATEAEVLCRRCEGRISLALGRGLGNLK